MGDWTLIPQIKVRESYIENHWRCVTQLFMLNEALLIKCKGHLRVKLYLFYCIWAYTPPKKGMDTWKVIQSVKLHISNKIKSNSRVKANWESSYTCFGIFGKLGRVREIGPKMSQIMFINTQKTQKVIQSVKLHI